METGKQEEKVIEEDTEAKRKKGFLNAFINFLSMGGFILVLIAIVAIVVLVSALTK